MGGGWVTAEERLSPRRVWWWWSVSWAREGQESWWDRAVSFLHEKAPASSVFALAFLLFFPLYLFFFPFLENMYPC